MNRFPHFPAVALIGLLVSCTQKNECIGDCSGASTSQQVTPACAQATDLATEFITQNDACETVLDCVSADAICYRGTASGACGSVALSASADLDAWAGLEAQLQQTCECGAPLCGAALMCSDAGQCNEIFGDDLTYCQSILRDVHTFLDAHRTCTTAADCVFAMSTCYVDECYGVALAVDTNLDDWKTLDSALAECDLPNVEMGQPVYCNVVGDCGASIDCVSGQCTAMFP